jgi:catechol 2,3-dioxygenase-like lactoylglutathione lyase family enzyme
MPINALDHINIITAQLDETCEFYAVLLGLERRNGPMELPPESVQWMYTPGGKALFHITTPQFRNIYPVPGPEVSPTGAINHIALDCSGFADMVERLDVMGAEYRSSGIDSVRLKQIFTSDPNQVLLELNFRDE